MKEQKIKRNRKIKKHLSKEVRQSLLAIRYDLCRF